MFIYSQLLDNVIKSIYWYSKIKDVYNLSITNKRNRDICNSITHTDLVEIDYKITIKLIDTEI